MKKFLLFLFSLLVGTGLFFWILKTVGWQEIKKVFLVFTGWQGLIILLLTFLMALVGTWKWQEILKGLDAKIPLKKLLGAYLAGFSIRYLAPIAIVASEIFQGHILKEMNFIPWSRGMASVVVDRILEWTANLAVIFFGILFFLSKIGLPAQKLCLIFGGALFLFTLLIGFFYFKSFKRESMAKAIARVFNHRLDSQPLEIEMEIFNFFKPRKKTMWKGFILAFLRAGIMWFRAWLLIVFLGKSIQALPSLSVLGFSYLASTIPIPAAIGSHEAVQAFAFNSLGMGVGAGTAFTMIIRAAELILALLGLVIVFKLEFELLKKLLFRKVEKISGKLKTGRSALIKNSMSQLLQ
jgi:uncharacterized protein (TIRG00374 family)